MQTEKLEEAILKGRNSLSSDKLDMSFGEIINIYTDGELVIDPEFQRLFRWDIHQRTRFIESLLLGIPIPSIFVAEDDKGRWEVVDGLQRISTIVSFFGLLKNSSDKNGWELEKGDIIEELEGFSIDELPFKLRLNIKRAACRFEIIKWNSDYDMRFELFSRLNTGGSLLTDQEIRNCIFRGISVKFTNDIKEFAASEQFVNLIRPTEKQKLELYLDELVLRFFSLFNNHQNIKKNLSDHMTDYMREGTEDNSIYQGKLEIFRRTLAIVSQLEYGAIRSRNNQFSTSLYDGILNGVADNIDYYENVNIEEVEQKVKMLKSDEEFEKASGAASNNKGRTKKRIIRALEVFSSHE